LEFIDLKQVKKGEIVTIFYLHSYFKDWFYQTIRVDTVGRRYVYGYSVSMEDGVIVNHGWPRKIDAKNALIVRGYPEDLIKQFLSWRNEILKWRDRKAKAKQEIYEKIRETVLRELGEWVRNNPPPKNPIEALIEKLKTFKYTA